MHPPASGEDGAAHDLGPRDLRPRSQRGSADAVWTTETAVSA